MPKDPKEMNAGRRLWLAQLAQGTNFNAGLDPHIARPGESGINAAFYADVSMLVEAAKGNRGLTERIEHDMNAVLMLGHTAGMPSMATRTCAGVLAYVLLVIEAMWEEGIRSYKPQAAFYEKLGILGAYILSRVADRIRSLGQLHGERVFLVLDAKRGDIDSTQSPYYEAYLSRRDEEVLPGYGGIYQFDTITVTTWMGEDVLSPGLPFFASGRGAIVVNDSSNPSHAQFQKRPTEHDGRPVSAVGIDADEYAELVNMLGRRPTVSDEMLYLTERFCRTHGLVDDAGISPIFSVMGATVRFDATFRLLRPSGTALIPGWGHQGGKWAHVMPLARRDGPQAGQLGICSSSRAHMYAWLPKYGGEGSVRKLREEIRRAVRVFREEERAAYVAARLDWPF